MFFCYSPFFLPIHFLNSRFKAESLSPQAGSPAWAGLSLGRAEDGLLQQDLHIPGTSLQELLCCYAVSIRASTHCMLMALCHKSDVLLLQGSFWKNSDFTFHS